MRILPSIFLMLLMTMPAPAATRRRTASPEMFPPCSTVNGTAAVTFTRDEGGTLTAAAERLTGIGYTYGLTALDANTVLSWHRKTLSLSRDAGCSWVPVGDFETDYPPALVASGGRAFAWSDARRFLLRYDSRGPVVLKVPGNVIGLAIDRRNADHLRIGTGDSGIWDSRDAGASWDFIGMSAPIAQTLVYRVAFDPANLDHVVSGSASSGIALSGDGGKTWRSATGLGKSAYNAFQVLVSPADGNYVWAMILDTSAQNDSAHGRHIVLSTDGGVSFRTVIDASASVTLVNGPVMAAHPANRNVLYFVFGTYFQGYGTDLFRYDDASAKLTFTHNAYDDIDAIAFSPADPRVMYLGLEVQSAVSTAPHQSANPGL